METTRRGRGIRPLIAVAGVILTVAWARGTPADDAPAITGGVAMPATVEALPRVSYVGRFALTPTHGRPGATVTATGEGLPADTELELVWSSVRGQWVTRGAYNEEFHGRRFDPTTRTLARVRTDGSGRLRTTFTVPEDYGFVHDLRLVQDGVVRNQAAFSIDMHAKITPASGPPGTPIEIVLEGVGWRSMENSWMLVYDNRFTGWLSAVTTPGVARATIPAVGAPGKHVVQIIHGSFTMPYMNMQQSPRPERPTFTLEFTVTPGAPILPPPAHAQSLPIEAAARPEGPAPRIWTDVVSGPVGTPIRLQGRGFAPGRAVDFAWTTVIGNRMSGDGWSESRGALRRAVADADGNVALALAAPDDLGGPHAIVAHVGDAAIETRFTITPSALPLDRTSGPVGTPFSVHLKGVGWTETANIYHLVYDNAYVGYACGFNSQGDVQMPLIASGRPGWHFVDVYPGIYRGQDAPGVQNFRIPQLTYAADHPGERLPAFRFAFYVTE